MADTFTKAERSRIMAAVKGKNTTPEMVVRRLVHSLGFRLRLRGPKMGSGASKTRSQSLSRGRKMGTGTSKTPSQSPFCYRLHVRTLPGCPDLVFPRLRKIILVSGCFWHMHGCGRCRIPVANRAYWIAKLQRNAARDRRTRRALRQASWRVLVVWECQTVGAQRARLRVRLQRYLAD